MFVTVGVPVLLGDLEIDAVLVFVLDGVFDSDILAVGV